jgi:hypothetical protein
MTTSIEKTSLASDESSYITGSVLPVAGGDVG